MFITLSYIFNSSASQPHFSFTFLKKDIKSFASSNQHGRKVAIWLLIPQIFFTCDKMLKVWALERLWHSWENKKLLSDCLASFWHFHTIMMFEQYSIRSFSSQVSLLKHINELRLGKKTCPSQHMWTGETIFKFKICLMQF